MGLPFGSNRLLLLYYQCNYLIPTNSKIYSMALCSGDLFELSVPRVMIGQRSAAADCSSLNGTSFTCACGEGKLTMIGLSGNYAREE
jgi:hypothetical protein